MSRIRIGLLAVALATMMSHGQPPANPDSEVLALPSPQMDGGAPLFRALKERKSTKEFSATPLKRETLSSLLWAAFGVNRPESGMRTAPSAKNKQEVSVYVVMADGAYRYDAVTNTLKRVAEGDHRKATGAPDSAGGPPVELVYVADFAQSAGATDDEKRQYAAVTTGCIIQNVYLFCASERLATVTRVASRRDDVAKALGLSSSQWPVMAQSVGFPRT